VTDATIVVPTYRHAALIPYSIRSALAQEGASIELFVVGDGVEDDTREAVEPFLSDPRVRFFDFPKGAGNGELSRHEALGDARGTIVCYLSDDDLLLPDHVVEMLRLLEDADFAHSAPLVVLRGGALGYAPIDVSRPEFQALLLRGGWNKIALTGAAHTLAAYRRLPHGWQPAPPGVWSDHHMWQQLLGLPGFRGVTATKLTHLHLPDAQRRDVSVADRVEELERWWRRMHEPGFADELERLSVDAIREAALVREARIPDLTHAIRHVQSTRWWRLRTYVASRPVVREMVDRRRTPG
jgi:glycosyltransferase involved in cell wall biosynthesis